MPCFLSPFVLCSHHGLVVESQTRQDLESQQLRLRYPKVKPERRISSFLSQSVTSLVKKSNAFFYTSSKLELLNITDSQLLKLQGSFFCCHYCKGLSDQAHSFSFVNTGREFKCSLSCFVEDHGLRPRFSPSPFGVFLLISDIKASQIRFSSECQQRFSTLHIAYYKIGTKINACCLPFPGREKQVNLELLCFRWFALHYTWAKMSHTEIRWVLSLEVYMLFPQTSLNRTWLWVS